MLTQELTEYFELLRFASVGIDPKRAEETFKCAEWLKRWLEKTGFAVKLVSDGRRPPVVFATRLNAPGAKTVLFYAHYDVQPEDPAAEWVTPAFEPVVKGDRVYCRGSQDDKGQFFAFLCGLREFVLNNPDSLNFKIILEGQEESGSEYLTELLKGDFANELQSDILFVCDTSAALNLRPAIIAGLRGLVSFTVTLSAANRDLHSGEYGGLAPNPAQGIAELVASLHNPDGSIAVAGFRDGIVPPTHEELIEAGRSMADAAEYREDIGVEPCGGQMGKTIAERNCFEPTIEINGIHSGYGGPGSKTVIPNTAIAKISMRLVPGQSAEQCRQLVCDHLRLRCPRGMKLAFGEFCGEAPGFRLPLDSELFRSAAGVLREMDPRGAVFLWDGASIPVIAAIASLAGAMPLLVGWGQAEDRIHSPNESYSLRQFSLARTWAVKMLARLK